MAKVYDHLTEEIKGFIRKQKMFFVGTSSCSDGDINISPKGYDTLRILEENRILYLDYHGSGNETANHLNENGRITFMWCSFEENENILRAYGKGDVVTKDSENFRKLHENYFSDYPKEMVRQIFTVHIYKVMTSCGWGVPFMSYIGDRPKLHTYSQKKFIKEKEADG